MIFGDSQICNCGGWQTLEFVVTFIWSLYPQFMGKLSKQCAGSILYSDIH